MPEFLVEPAAESFVIAHALGLEGAIKPIHVLKLDEFA